VCRHEDSSLAAFTPRVSRTVLHTDQISVKIEMISYTMAFTNY